MSVPSVVSPPLTAAQYSQGKIKLVVIGDVHDQWDPQTSVAALKSLNPDIVCFVGDFGNEDVALIRHIASIPLPKSVILGNHDSWFSLTPRGRDRAIKLALATSNLKNITNPPKQTAVQDQLQALGSDHVGFSSKFFPQHNTAIVGARPFTKGGKRWDDISAFYEQYYNIHSLEESAHKILDVLLSQPHDAALVMLAHNGPTGLGNRRFNICGVDWQEPEEDFGDIDLREALDMAATQGKSPALVLCGHMHHSLKNGGRRNMAYVDDKTGTVFLNAAVVPRIRKFTVDTSGNSTSSNSESGGAQQIKAQHFMIVEMLEGIVAGARNVWVGGVPSSSSQPSNAAGSDGNSSISVQYKILEEEEMLKTVAAQDGTNRLVHSVYKAYSNEWQQVVVEHSAKDSQLCSTNPAGAGLH